MAYLVWRLGKYAEILQSYREDDRVRQLRVAYLGRRPVITEALKRQIADKYPGIDIDWSKIEDEVRAKVGDTRDEDVARELKQWQDRLKKVQDAVLRPVLWAFFEARRRGQSLSSDEPMLWDREDRPPRRRPTYSDRMAQEEIWPIFRRIMEDRADLDQLFEDPEVLSEAVRRGFNKAEFEYTLQKQDKDQSDDKPGKPKKPERLGYDEALRILELPTGKPLGLDEVREAYRARWEQTSLSERVGILEEARKAAEEYVCKRAWR